MYIYPGSCCFQKNPEWVIYHELVLTTKEYMRNTTQIEPKWLIEYAPDFYRLTDPNRISDAKRAQKIEPLFNKHEDPNAWRISKRKY